MFLTKQQFSFINQILEVKYHDDKEQGFMARIYSLSERSNAIGIYQKIHKNVTEDETMFIDGEIKLSLGENKLLQTILKESMPLAASRIAEDILHILENKDSLSINA